MQKNAVITTPLQVGALLLLATGLAAVIGHYLSYTVDSQRLGEFAEHIADYRALPLTTFAHLGPSFVMFALAPFQLLKPLRTRVPALHRWTGRVFVACGLISGSFGVVLAIVLPIGGVTESIVTVPLGIYFLYALWRAFSLARARQFLDHRAWMIRALAAALAISMQRLWLGALLALSDTLTFAGAFNLAIVLGAATTIGAGELYLKLKPRA